MPATTTARILTVDDNAIVRADLRLMLEDAGFEVVPDARDGIEAVDLAREHKPDLVLIDLSLPNLDGVEATRQILHERDVPVVALTGHSRGDFVQRAVDAGAVGHVFKPFSRVELVATVSGALADRADREEYARWIQLAMIESMVWQGRSEHEIVTALGVGEPATRGTLRRLLGRLA
ncbi:MAG: pdtaR [Actinomycetia bacterium]|nr:pdtaR [Actinomycetes bacterium]